MDPTRLMTQPATITPRVAADSDDYNNEVLADGNPIELDGTRGNGVLLQPYRQGSEDVVGTDTTLETWIVYLPAEIPFTAADKITIDGRDYEAADVPRAWWNPRLRRNTHVEATVKRIE